MFAAKTRVFVLYFSTTTKSSDLRVVENAIVQRSVFATSTQIEDLLSKFPAKIAINTRFSARNSALTLATQFQSLMLIADFQAIYPVFMEDVLSCKC